MLWPLWVPASDPAQAVNGVNIPGGTSSAWLPARCRKLMEGCLPGAEGSRVLSFLIQVSKITLSVLQLELAVKHSDPLCE